MDKGEARENAHTKVCQPQSPFASSILALFANEIELQRLTLTGLALEMGYNRRSLKRMLTGEKQLSVRDIFVICRTLGIDRLTAWFAIELMGNWEFYYDVTLRIAVNLLKPVVLKINMRARAAMEPLTPKAIEQLSDWIANQLLTNQEQIYSRRDQFVDLPLLQAAIR